MLVGHTINSPFRYPVEEMIERRIAPSRLPGWCCNGTKKYGSTMYDESIISFRDCQMRAYIPAISIVRTGGSSCRAPAPRPGSPGS